LRRSFDIWICSQRTGEFNFPFISSHDLSADSPEITCEKLVSPAKLGIRALRVIDKLWELAPK
jgi:hypothetical protein